MTTLTDPFFLNTVLWARTGEDQTVSFMDLQSASVHEIRTQDTAYACEFTSWDAQQSFYRQLVELGFQEDRQL